MIILTVIQLIRKFQVAIKMYVGGPAVTYNLTANLKQTLFFTLECDEFLMCHWQ